MQYTENYKFLLPDGTDKVNIENINKNFKSIDNTLYNHENNIKLVWRTAQYVEHNGTQNFWRREKWSDGFNKIWCKFSPHSDIVFDRTNSDICEGIVVAKLPEVFLLSPDYVSVIAESDYHVSCAVYSVSKTNLMLKLVNHEAGTETESTISKDEISFYIEISGYVQQSSEE